MLKRVLAGNDYYENPDMIKIKNYSGIEWRNLLKNNGDNEKGKTEESQNKESDEILFGTDKGLLSMKPERMKRDSHASNLIITDIHINGEKKEPSYWSSGITLSHKENSFSINYETLDMKFPN